MRTIRKEISVVEIVFSQNEPCEECEGIRVVERLKASLKENLQIVKQSLGNSDDLTIREARIGSVVEVDIAILYIDGLTDKQAIDDFISEALMLDFTSIETDPKFPVQPWISMLRQLATRIGNLKNINDFQTLCDSLLSGEAVILLDGQDEGIAAGTQKWKERSVSEPTSQSVVRGPRESFTENLRTNTALIRRKIKDPRLWLENNPIGKVTKTDVAVMYIKGIADDKVLEEVRRRLKRIEIDGILESGYIEELIQDETYTPFPTIYNTERPDAIAAGLLEGRIAILVDGTPFVLLVPALFVQFIHSAEDYYQRSDFATLIRIVRYFALFFTLLAPSLYIAITTFHREMIPTPLLISFAAQREGVPFPAFIEAFAMEITFEILREAGLRMPRAVGQAVSIVGTLVIGTAAVEAGFVSAAMVIIVSITAISSFVIPSINMSIAYRMIRFPLMVLAASFGLFGIIMGIIAMLLHMCSLRSFGVPYMSPLGPFNMNDQKDAILRKPLSRTNFHPRFIRRKNRIRQ